jgi:hypothetical protein
MFGYWQMFNDGSVYVKQKKKLVWKTLQIKIQMWWSFSIKKIREKIQKKWEHYHKILSFFKKNIAFLGEIFHPKKMLLVMQCDTWNNQNWNLIIV